MPTTGNNKLICLEKISYAYTTDASTQNVLHDASFSIPKGQSCAIVGASDSGKSTLLSLIGLLDEPTTSRLLLAGEDMSRVNARSLIGEPGLSLADEPTGNLDSQTAHDQYAFFSELKNDSGRH